MWLWLTLLPEVSYGFWYFSLVVWMDGGRDGELVLLMQDSYAKFFLVVFVPL